LGGERDPDLFQQIHRGSLVKGARSCVVEAEGGKICFTARGAAGDPTAVYAVEGSWDAAKAEHGTVANRRVAILGGSSARVEKIIEETRTWKWVVRDKTGEWQEKLANALWAFLRTL
jgi:hypothetical protein